MDIKFSRVCFIFAGLLQVLNAFAQLENSGIIYNDGENIDNFQAWSNMADGSYTGINFGAFNHFGPSRATFINHGIYKTSLGHKDIFKGPGATQGIQEIGGTIRPEFYDLDFVNGTSSETTITNEQGISVSGNLNFSNGITSTVRDRHHAGSIRFESGASYLNGNSDTQHVNGYVSKVGNSAFIFPLGSGTDLRTLEISAPENATALYSTSWIAGDPSGSIDPSDASPEHPVNMVQAPIESVAKIGQWDWITLEGATNDLAVKVSIPDVSNLVVASDLRLVGWNGTVWMDLSGRETASGVTENSIITGIIPSGLNITALAIGSINKALPVNLISFNVTIDEKKNTQLLWATTSELNNDFFQIEHSTDGKAFNIIGKVSGKGRSDQVSHYSFLHQLSQPYGGHYYRLRQVDFNGLFTYSNIRSVDFGQPGIMIYPNPSNDKINIQPDDRSNLQSVELFDESGRMIYRSSDRSGMESIGTKNLNSGTYILHLNYLNGSMMNKKILIAK